MFSLNLTRQGFIESRGCRRATADAILVLASAWGLVPGAFSSQLRRHPIYQQYRPVHSGDSRFRAGGKIRTAYCPFAIAQADAASAVL